MKTLFLVEARDGVDHMHIGFIRLIREKANLSLSQSKAAFEDFLEQRSLQIDITSDSEEEFLSRAWELGFLCRFKMH